MKTMTDSEVLAAIDRGMRRVSAKFAPQTQSDAEVRPEGVTRRREGAKADDGSFTQAEDSQS